MSHKKGFTLLEILLVVGIIAILAGIVIVAINPARQLAQTRNAERRSDLKQLHSAMVQYYIDHGFYPASSTLSTTLKEICNTGSLASSSVTVDGVSCGTLINLSYDLVPTYITAIPEDPQGSTLAFIPKALASTNGNGYQIALDSTNKIIAAAPQAELGVVIAVGTTTGTTTGTSGCVATGGNETTVGGYKIHTFTNPTSYNFHVTSGPCDVDVLVVAGGGTGGGKAGTNDWFGGGGGGAGGIVVKTGHTLSSTGDYAVTVGSGGVWDAVNIHGSNGSDSLFDTITAIGGGYGGNNSLCTAGSGQNPDYVNGSGQSGGSGGGAGANSTSYFGQGIQGPSSGGSGFGNPGGYAQGGSPYPMGGGGGASTEGGTGSGSQSGAGGDGLYNDFSGSLVLYGGGGGGAAHEFGSTRGLGGLGGGGNGAIWDSNHSAGGDGVANTGGGGGGGQSTGGAGGSGIVIVRYAI